MTCSEGMLAIPHQGVERRQALISCLTKALLKTGALSSNGGTLVQTWMPTIVTEGLGSAVTLATKGLPFSLIGPGDMLAAFRCLSCTYTFTTDRCQLTRMGAPGRVFISGEVETCDNLQQCNANIYLRVRDAAVCGVTSTVLLPVFCSPRRRDPVAVLEINQFGANTNYSRVFAWAQTNLEEQDLFLPSNMAASVFEMQSHAISIQYASSGNSALGSLLSCTPSTDEHDPGTLAGPRVHDRAPQRRDQQEGEAESTQAPDMQAQASPLEAPGRSNSATQECGDAQPSPAASTSHNRGRPATASLSLEGSTSGVRGGEEEGVSPDEAGGGGDSREAESPAGEGAVDERCPKRVCRRPGTAEGPDDPQKSEGGPEEGESPLRTVAGIWGRNGDPGPYNPGRSRGQPCSFQGLTPALPRTPRTGKSALPN